MSKPRAKKHCYEYPRPALTVDAVVFGLGRQQQLQVLLIERGGEPFKGQWALPGGFINAGQEGLDEAVKRELLEETGVRPAHLEQLYTFGAPDRDPREHVVSVAYSALVRSSDLVPKAGDDAKRAQWWNKFPAPPLAFDHSTIICLALARLRTKIRYEPIGMNLLPETFTLGQLQTMYESILGRQLDRRNFRRKVMSYELIDSVDDFVTVGSRKAQLFQFNWKQYMELKKKGFNFEV